MTECDIFDWHVKVGDVVQFKTLEELFEEFGAYNEEGDISSENGLHAGFSSGMEYLCGQVFTIRSILAHEDYLEFRSVEGIENAPLRWSGHWIISDHMIKPYNESSDVEVSEEAFLDVLLGK